MENNRNWPGIAALVLAGLALLVALAGHGPNFDLSGHVWSGQSDAAPSGAQITKPGNQSAVPVAPVPPVAVQPVAPVAPDPRSAVAQAQAKLDQAQQDLQTKIAQAQAEAQAAAAGQKLPGPPTVRVNKFGPPWATGFGSPSNRIAGAFHAFGALVQLVLFGLVLFLVFRWFRRRGRTVAAAARGPQGPQGPPPAEPPPGPRPTVKL